MKRNRILLVGFYWENNGPNNVNKEIIRYMDDDFIYVKSKNRYIKFVEATVKVLKAQTVLVSGMSKVGFFTARIAKHLNKKIVFIMHGCVAYEKELNCLSGMENTIAREQCLIEMADRLLPVSAKFAEWVKMRYPEASYKVCPWPLGVNQSEVQTPISKKEKGLVIAAGGDRNQKNNSVLCDVMCSINGDARLEIYGDLQPGKEHLENAFISWMGIVPNDQFLERLRCAEVFVINSVLEPFSIAVFEALAAGCSVLVSQYVGAAELMKLEAEDIIFDPYDREEIKQKLIMLLRQSNNQRISEQIDWNQISYKNAIKRLKDLCNL